MKTMYSEAQAVCITDASDLFYFSSYSNADACIVLTPQKNYYFTDDRMLREVSSLLSSDFAVLPCKGDSYLQSAIKLIKDLRIKKVGVVGSKLLYDDFCALDDANLTIIDVTLQVASLRASKTEREIALISKAQAVTDNAFSYITSQIKAGMTERQLCAMLNAYIYSCGATLAFDTIVAFGANTANPHAHPTDNALVEGDPITLDFGAKYDGYCSDMTRSFCIGSAKEEYVNVYNLVLLAQETAIKGLKAGMTGRSGDALARDVFRKSGFESNFTHSLGHSLGVDIHEAPNLSPRYDGIIPQNAVTSVEPGLYFDSKFGVRIEDIVVFQKSDVYNLTKSKKQLIII